jgi:SAM-dependent methyltransferase
MPYDTHPESCSSKTANAWEGSKSATVDHATTAADRTTTRSPLSTHCPALVRAIAIPERALARRPTLARVPPLSRRLAEIVDALPLRPGLRVIEIGCGPGAAARAVADRVGATGHVLAIDRSAKAIAQLTDAAAELIAAGRLTPRQVAAEALELAPGERRYDIAFAVRVGAFDGRYPGAGAQALERLSRALVPGGRLFVDGGDPLREIVVPA